VPARKLLEYARLLPEGDVNMKFLENHWASITCGRSKTRIAGMSRESFPELPQMPEQIAEIPTKLLASMIARTSFAISMEESRFTLNGALLFLRPEASRWCDRRAPAGVRAGGGCRQRANQPSNSGRWFPRRR